MNQGAVSKRQQMRNPSFAHHTGIICETFLQLKIGHLSSQFRAILENPA